MNKISNILLSVILSVAASYFLITKYGNLSSQTEVKQSVYERVISSGILRCGYFAEAPFTIIDPNTGKHTGIAVELAEKIAEELGLKIDWVSAESFGTLTADLKNGRYDAICASLFNLPRAGQIDYTIPYTYVPVYAYTQDGRTDFDGKFEQINWSNVTIAGLDGEGSTTIARKQLPSAKFAILPETMQVADMLTSVADKKADMGFVMPTVFKNFDNNNPHLLKRIVTDKPFYVFNVSFGIKPNEPALKNMLDFMMRNLEAEGFLQTLFDKYDPEGLLFRPVTLYKSSEIK